jgi:tetraacyldisaccharide 4'-kinase
MVTVAVDKSRIKGCDFLAHPEKLHTEKAGRRCKDKNLPAADLIILDDAYQHRALKPTLSIVLIDFNRPTYKDHLLPIGKLRDLPERVHKADMLIVTKCPYDMNSWQKCIWAENLGLRSFDAQACCGTRADGKKQYVFFSQIAYDTPEAVFPEGDARYVYTKRLIMFSGIANDKPMARWLSGDYKIVRHYSFSDHHNFSRGDISSIASAAKVFPTAVIMTTEKDAQRVRDNRFVKDDLKQRMFYLPIKTRFVTEEEGGIFISAVKRILTGSDSETPQTPHEQH